MCILDKFSKEEISEIIEENPKLRGYVQGYLAEYDLKKYISSIPHVTSVTKVKDNKEKKTGKKDLLVIYKDTVITIESKSLLTDTIQKRDDGTWEAKVQTKNTDTRDVILPDGNSIYSCLMLRDQFDILAISLYQVDKKWKFAFMPANKLPKPDKKTKEYEYRDYFVKNPFRLHLTYTPGVTLDLPALLEQIYRQKLECSNEQNIKKQLTSTISKIPSQVLNMMGDTSSSNSTKPESQVSSVVDNL